MKVKNILNKHRLWFVYAVVVLFVFATTYYVGKYPSWIIWFCIAQFILLYTTALGLVPRLDCLDNMASFSRLMAFLVFAFSAALNILSFAIFHMKFGLMDTTVAKIVSDFSVALYFSIVTFTTLGFGDVQPVSETRLVTALQAVTGYIYLGLGVGLVIHGYRPAKD